MLLEYLNKPNNQDSDNLLIQFVQHLRSQPMSIISFNDFQCKYRFDCQLSQGSFGRVCRIQQIKTKKYFALKKITVKKKQQLEEIQNEIRLLHRYRHPFVVQIRQTYNIQIQNGFAKPIWEVGIILQLAKCSLQHLIRLKKTPTSFQFLAQQAAGLIKILFILQQQNIVHRDIKPANILIFELPQNRQQWKLADFGLSLDLSRSREGQNFAGSFEYASPKLKRKFKYPGLKIKTNNYKDDVYSLGVTLLETITGLRNYNNQAYEKLRQICLLKKLVDLIDMMLQQDQQKRPCFKQLMIVIEKDFSEIIGVKDHQHQNRRQFNKIQMTKKKYSFSQQNLQIQQKTVVKNQQKILKKTVIKTGKPIQCIAHLDGAFMCGCDNGQLVFIANNHLIQCGIIHKRNVSQFFVDEKGNIWSVGGDSTIRKWSKNHLLKALMTQVKQVKIIQDNFLKKNEEKVILVLQIKQSYYEQFDLPFFHKCGISNIFVVDKQNFAVGYFNGYVYIRWNGGEFHCQIFKDVVTSIKTSNNGKALWICSLDGQLKCIITQNLTLLNKFYFKNNSRFIQMYIHEDTLQQSISLLTMDGRHLVLNNNLECIYENIIGKQMIMASTINNNKNCYILMENGQIYDLNEQKVAELNSKGWSCMAISPQNQIVAASFLGHLAFIQF